MTVYVSIYLLIGMPSSGNSGLGGSSCCQHRRYKIQPANKMTTSTTTASDTKIIMIVTGVPFFFKLSATSENSEIT